MSASQFFFFIGWLAAALIGAGLLLYVWQQLRAKFGADDQK
jgi:hypothetical protein